MVYQNWNPLILTGNVIEARISWEISSVLLAGVYALLYHLLKARSIFENYQMFISSTRNLMTVVSVCSDFSLFDMLINDSWKADRKTRTLHVYGKETKWKKSSVLRADWTMIWAFFWMHIFCLTSLAPMKIWTLKCLPYIFPKLITHLLSLWKTLTCYSLQP